MLKEEGVRREWETGDAQTQQSMLEVLSFGD